MNYFSFFLVFFILNGIQAQVLTLKEAFAIVLEHHPIVKQAQLSVLNSRSYLLEQRGFFDPKLYAEHGQKLYEDKSYYNLTEAGIKVPIWYGIEAKAAYNQHSGYYLNPENRVPQNGLVTAGVSVNLLQGFLINEGMANVQKGQVELVLSQQDSAILVNTILYKTAQTYVEWSNAYYTHRVYNENYNRMLERFQMVKRSFILGDKSAMDTLEAYTELQSRDLQKQAAQLQLKTSVNQLSELFWYNNTPYPIPVTLVPDSLFLQGDLLSGVLNLDTVQHPYIQYYEQKIKLAQIDLDVKRDKLKPKLQLSYNFLTSSSQSQQWNPNNYKLGLNFSFPILLRKERGSLQQGRFKLEQLGYDKELKQREIWLKFTQYQVELEAYKNQIRSYSTAVDAYKKLVVGEEKKYELGDGTLFYILARELKAIDAEVKLIELHSKRQKALMGLVYSMFRY